MFEMLPPPSPSKNKNSNTNKIKKIEHCKSQIIEPTISGSSDYIKEISKQHQHGKKLKISHFHSAYLWFLMRSYARGVFCKEHFLLVRSRNPETRLNILFHHFTWIKHLPPVVYQQQVICLYILTLPKFLQTFRSDECNFSNVKETVDAFIHQRYKCNYGIVEIFVLNLI